jgi:DNA-binding response OmpR family regulator
MSGDVASAGNRSRGLVLVVEDDPDMARLITHSLTREGFETEWTPSGEAGLGRIRRGGIDLVILDILLPGIDGHEVCRRIRADPTREHLPIIMLTAKSEDVDAAEGLDTGADDYIKKPFSVIELAARVKAALRRVAPSSAGDESQRVVSCLGLVLSPARHTVTIDGEAVQLTLAEFKLLYFLMAHHERAFSRDELLPHVVGPHVRVVDRNIDVHVRNIRKKIGNYADRIVTVRGIGYRFEMDNAGATKDS